MIQFLCIFFPAVISVLIIMKIRNESINTQQFLIYYVLFTIFINLIAFFILFINQTHAYLNPESFYETLFAVKYLLLLSFLAAVSAYVLEYSRKYIRVNFFIQEIEKPEQKKKKDRIIAIIKDILFFGLLFASLFLLFVVRWLFLTFAFLNINELIFHLVVPLEGVGTNMKNSFILKVLLPSLVPIIICFLITRNSFIGKNMGLTVKTKNRQTQVSLLPFNLLKKYLLPVVAFLFLFSFIFAVHKFGASDLNNYFFKNSSFIEDNYIDTENIKLTFPDKKRNLIFVFLESIEVTSLSSDWGGAAAVNLIPELTGIALENINFSDTQMIGGAQPISGSGWTVAAMVAQHAGIPLKLPIQGNSYTGYAFLPGVISLGDILDQQGYNQTLIVGSDATYAGRDKYFIDHGKYRILDLYTAYDDDIVPQGYNVWWGFEDLYLYEYAKKELNRLNKEGKPFNLTLLTVDTHHIGGYVCSLCQDEHPKQMSNVISCADRQISNFLNWLKQQDYYDDTTIIISGDHLSMDLLYYASIDLDYVRKPLNIFINSAIPASNTTDRIFSSFDIFPTTLASMGVKIEGDRLGLGTNLFSDEETIFEIYGIKYVNRELSKRSRFYNRKILYRK